jgi:hypothetical protein
MTNKRKRTAAAAMEANLTAKARAMMQDIVAHHPLFRTATMAFRKWALENPDEFNVERMFEKTLAHLGGYKFTNAAHSDFSDKSDAKTASVQLKPATKCTSCHDGSISGIGNINGAMKSGALRVCIYIAPKQEMRYYYLPKKFWSKLTLSTKPSGEVFLKFTYNSKNDTIAKFEFCRVKNIVELAKAAG